MFTGQFQVVSPKSTTRIFDRQTSGFSDFAPRPLNPLTWDFAKAHRIVQVHSSDWGLQACMLDRPANTPSEEIPTTAKLLLNTCGTYGVGCASYYWGRLGGLAVRAIHYLLAEPRYARAATPGCGT